MQKLIILLSCCCVGFAFGDEILPNLAGPALIEELRDEYKPRTTLTYRQAREQMFGQVDNEAGRVVLIYTGESYATTGIPPEREVNTEHVWPQSRFEDARGRSQMKCDLHHLYPSSSSVNARRGNNAFRDIPDEETRFWYISPLAQSQLPPEAQRAGFAEATGSAFEPREVDKGNIARSLLYFFAVYGDQGIDHRWFQPQLPTLLKWHEQDLPDDKERDRSRRIAAIQGTQNPFVLDNTLASRAFGQGDASFIAARIIVPADRLAERPAAMPAENHAAENRVRPEPIPGDETGARLRIGAWNIENLGTRGADSNADDQEPEDLAAYIKSSQVSLLALEEIHDNDQDSSETPGEAPWENELLNQTMTILEEETGHRWKYVLTAPSPANDRQQLTGVAWDTEALTLRARSIIPVLGGEVAGADVWTRRPEAFHFSAGEGRTDFAVVPLHMKSNSNGRAVGMATRVQEAQQLKAQLQDLTQALEGEEDLILLGDTNMVAGETTAAVQWGDKFRDLNVNERYTYIKPYRNEPFPPFDRIFVPNGQPEFADAEQMVHGPYGSNRDERREWRQEHLEKRSDHLLIWTDIEVTSDDD